MRGGAGGGPVGLLERTEHQVASVEARDGEQVEGAHGHREDAQVHEEDGQACVPDVGRDAEDLERAADLGEGRLARHDAAVASTDDESTWAWRLPARRPTRRLQGPLGASNLGGDAVDQYPGRRDVERESDDDGGQRTGRGDLRAG